MAASHGQLREYILRKKWDRPAGLAGRFFVLGEDGLPRRCAPRNDRVGGAACGYYGLPHRCAHRFAMTRLEVRRMRGVGEIGEAPPVAGEANRFRGSAPIGGHDSGRESAGTTVGNRRLLRKHNDLTRREGNTDCHVAPLLAMTVFLRGAVHTGRWGHRSLRMSWRARLVMGGILSMKKRLSFESRIFILLWGAFPWKSG